MSTATRTPATNLRPLERRVRQLVEHGVSPAEVAWRFRRSPRSVQQILELSTRPLREPITPADPRALRPLERRILALRDAGISYVEIASRFRRSPQFVRRVEEMARAKLARSET